MVQAWSELEAQYSTGPPVVDTEPLLAAEAPVVSCEVPVLDEVFMDCALLAEGQGSVSSLAEQLMEFPLSTGLRSPTRTMRSLNEQ